MSSKLPFRQRLKPSERIELEISVVRYAVIDRFQASIDSIFHESLLEVRAGGLKRLCLHLLLRSTDSPSFLTSHHARELSIS